MVLGLSLQTFTIAHVVITLIAIATGLLVMFGMLGSHRLRGWTAIFLLFTVLTSVTGFLFPFQGVTPAIGVGVVSSVILLIALIALYGKDLAGRARWIYALTAVAALYLNVFVLIVQSFEKAPLLKSLPAVVGPPFSEPQNTYFMIAQGIALLFFLIVGALAAVRFRPTILM